MLKLGGNAGEALIKLGKKYFPDAVETGSRLLKKAGGKVDDVWRWIQKKLGKAGVEGGSGSKFQEVFDLTDNYTLSDDTFNNHILDRHGPNSTYGNKSHFNADFDIRKVLIAH